MSIDSQILLPETPAVPGLRFRTYASEDDVPAMAELDRLVNAANGSTERWSDDDWRNEMRNRPNIDPREDYVLGFVGDRLVSLAWVNWADTSDGERHYRSLGMVHPDWRRRGIGGAMLTRNEARLRDFAAQHHLERPAQLITWLDDGDAGGHALISARGYQRVRIYHHMIRPDMHDIDVPPLPDGLDVRPVSRSDVPAVWDAIVEAFRDHFGGHDDSPQARQAWLDDPALDPRLFAVAYEGEEVAGGVLGYVNPEENEANGYLRGWTDPVFVRRRWRRRGLARALLGRCLVLLRDAGMTSAQLDVDTENANDALRLYREHGFETDRGSSEWHKPVDGSPAVPST
jgi:ribosomal protein S18 acetylase RimI-like enzyme